MRSPLFRQLDYEVAHLYATSPPDAGNGSPKRHHEFNSPELLDRPSSLGFGWKRNRFTFNPLPGAPDDEERQRFLNGNFKR